MKKALFLLVFILLLCGCTKVSPDPVLPIPTPAYEPGQLYMAETTIMKEETQTHTYQYYEYKNERLTRIYAPEGYIASRSSAPFIWELLNQEIREIEERYEYDGEYLVKVEGVRPSEIGGGGYVITLEYDGDRVIREKYVDGELQKELMIKYEDGRVKELSCSDGTSATYTYSPDSKPSIITISDSSGNYSKLYDYEETSVLETIPADDALEIRYVDGTELRVICSSEIQPYHELIDYDKTGRILYASREYENGNSSFTHFYYAEG